jgi:hypothetical protein
MIDAMPELSDVMPELDDRADGCVRCGEPFGRTAFDAELVYRLTGRDLPDGWAGRAIGDCCIEANELRALDAARRVDPDS